MGNADRTDVRSIAPDLLADRIVYLSGVALVYPRAMTNAEIQELAAAVVAHQQAARREREMDILGQESSN